MGSAIISRIKSQYRVTVSEKDRVRANALKKKFRVKIAGLSEGVKNAHAIILAVKPQDFDNVLAEIKSSIKNQLVISIAAGITASYIEKRLGKVRVIRTMPNLPAQVGQGMTGISKGKYAGQKDLAIAVKLFNKIGETVVVEEKWLDAITAVSGSGPAYVFLFAEMLTQAAKQLGFSDAVAKKLVLQTLKGSLNLLENSNEDASVLRERVTSKGGTTQAALNVFSKHKFQETFTQALKAAKKRAGELSK